MTIASTPRKAGPSQGNGTNAAFPFTFKVFLSAEVLVTYLNAVGTELVLTLGTDYTVTLNADQNASPGGSVTLLWIPATGTYITLASQVSNTQNLLLTNSGGFYPTSINDALDRVVIQIQQLAEQVSRAAKAPLSGIGSLIPSSLVFGVDATGTPILSQLASISSTAVSTFMGSLLGLTTQASAQAALGIGAYIQKQINTAVLTTGSSTAYVATASPAIAIPIANTRLRVKLHVAGGVSPTLTVGSVTANLQQYNATGALVAATLSLNQLTDVEYNGSVWVVLNPLPLNLALSPVITSPVIAGNPSGVGVLTQMTQQVISTQTPYIDFTGIPSWVKKITILFSDIRVNGTAGAIIQIGAGTAPETTGYVGTFVRNLATSIGSAAYVGAGIPIYQNMILTPSPSIGNGIVVLTLHSNSMWVANGDLSCNQTTTIAVKTTGIKTITGSLGIVRITATNTITDSLDIGTINVMYE